MPTTKDLAVFIDETCSYRYTALAGAGLGLFESGFEAWVVCTHGWKQKNRYGQQNVAYFEEKTTLPFQWSRSYLLYSTLQEHERGRPISTLHQIVMFLATPPGSPRWQKANGVLLLHLST